MKTMKRLFRNVRWLLRAMLLLCCVTFVMACSDDNDKHSKPIPLYSYNQLYYEETNTTSTENGLTITRDEAGRVVGIESFMPGDDFVEKLMSAPTSFDEIKYLFPLSEGNEIRLIGSGKNPPIGENSDYRDLAHYEQSYENYNQYYKNVPVSSWFRINYFITPEGKRLSYAMGSPFIDVKNLDPKPSITEQQARQVLADYLDIDSDDSWTCSLLIREYVTKKDGKIQRDIRLIYRIRGPYAPMDDNVYYITAPQYHAEVDAHTGQLLIFD